MLRQTRPGAFLASGTADGRIRLTEGAGKTVIRCADRPGFIVNRCARPFYGEALAMLEAGTPAARIDAAMMAALLPTGTVTIGLNPGGISGDGYALTFEGSMVAGPETDIPTGSATITLTGIETLQAFISICKRTLYQANALLILSR